MQLPLPAGSYKHPSRPTNYRTCINYFPTSPGPDGRGKITLLPTMGSQLINSTYTDEIRFIKRINNIVYFVIGSGFYSSTIDILSNSLDLNLIGNLNSSTGVVIGTNNPTQVMLVDGTDGYIYNFIFAGTVPLGPIGGTASDTYNLTINGISIYSGFSVATALSPSVLVSTINTHAATTHVTASYIGGLLTLTGDSTISSITVTESGTGFTAGIDGISVNPGVFSSALPFSQFQRITDPDFIGGSHVVYIDGYFIVNNKDSQSFQFSQPNEGRIWDGLDVASAESKPDNIVALGESKSELWVFGTDSIEVWFDQGNPIGAPFSKRVGSDIDIGCKAPYSVTNINNLVVWLDSRGLIVQSDISSLFRDQSTGYTLTKISDDALEAELTSYSRLDDAIGTTYVDRGHIKYEITFPTEKKTWVYDYSTNVWHERNKINIDTGDLEHSLCQFCDTYQGMIVCGGVRNGNIYFMKSNYYYDDTTPITRLFTTSHYNDDFKLIGVDSVEIKLLTGAKTNVGDLEDSKIIMQFSNDSGFSWSNKLQRSLGSIGDYNKRIIFNQLGTSYQWLLLFKITAPIEHAIIDLTANINIEKT